MPSQRISSALQAELIWQTTKIALELKVIGLMNVQFAVRQGRIYLLEVNLRASRTIPFLTKMTGIPLAQIAVNCILGKTLEEQQLPSPSFHSYVYMKKSVFPFKKFQEQDPVLGLQMQSTGEVMAIASNFDAAYAKAVCAGSDNSIFHSKDTNLKQQCFLSLNAEDYAIAQELTQTLLQLGWNVMVSTKLFNYLEKQGITDIIPIENTEAAINDLCEMLRAKKLHFVLAIDAPLAPGVWKKVRIQAIQSNIYLAFTAQEARAYFQALQKNEHLYPHSLLSLQEIHEINDRREKISLPHFFDKVSIQRVERTFISAY